MWYRITSLSILLLLFPLLLMAQEPVVGHEFAGSVSYYAKKFHGRKTASGEKMDRTEFTAAHRYFPFGTMIEVSNPRNGKTCVVRVNDRGPFVRRRVLDISYAAADYLGITQSGIASLKMWIVGIGGQVILSKPAFPWQTAEKFNPPFYPTGQGPEGE